MRPPGQHPRSHGERQLRVPRRRPRRRVLRRRADWLGGVPGSAQECQFRSIPSHPLPRGALSWPRRVAPTPRELEPEGGAAALTVASEDRAMVCLGDALHQREAQAQPGSEPSSPRVNLRNSASGSPGCPARDRAPRSAPSPRRSSPREPRRRRRASSRCRAGWPARGGAGGVGLELVRRAVDAQGLGARAQLAPPPGAQVAQRQGSRRHLAELDAASWPAAGPPGRPSPSPRDRDRRRSWASAPVSRAISVMIRSRASGVRSSCDTVASSSRWSAICFSMRAAISLTASATTPISSGSSAATAAARAVEVALADALAPPRSARRAAAPAAAPPAPRRPTCRQTPAPPPATGSASRGPAVAAAHATRSQRLRHHA